MKRNSMRWIVVLMLMMVMLSASSLGVSAATERPWMPGGVKTHPGYKSIAIQWKKSSQKHITGYRIYYSSNGKNFYLKKVLKCADYPNWKNTQNIVCKITGLSDNVLYRFRVKAYVLDKGKIVESNFMTVADRTIRPMWVYFRANGRNYIADRFSGGRFYVKGSNQQFPGVRVSGERADYTTAYNYSRLSAKYFINDRKYASSTGYLVWISTYTQRAYLMKGPKNTAGKWECIDDWDCATGKPTSPTPTGETHRKTIYKKVRSRHNVSWWSPFSSWNSLHGRVGDSMSLGRPSSGGCVRNPDEKAHFIYQRVPLNTPVIIY